MGLNFAMVDGSTFFINQDIDLVTYRALATRAGGETVSGYGICAIPPNFTYSDPDWWPNTHSFRSAHPMGLNFAMVDGSTFFINQDIDLVTYRALATRAGGETVSGY